MYACKALNLAQHTKMLKVFDLTETELKRLADVSNLFFPTSSQLSQENRIRMKYGIHIREAREKNHQCED